MAAAGDCIPWGTVAGSCIPWGSVFPHRFLLTFGLFCCWGNVFSVQEFKNITMTCTGIPPTLRKPLYGGYGGGGCIKSPLQGTDDSLCPPGAPPETRYPRGAPAGPRSPRSTARKVPREAPAEHANPRHPQRGLSNPPETASAGCAKREQWQQRGTLSHGEL